MITHQNSSKSTAINAFICILVVFIFLPNKSMGQIKKNLSYEIGTGLQFSKIKIEHSKYIQMYNKPVPKLFFGVNYMLPINSQSWFDIGSVFHFSRFENQLKFKSKDDEFSFNSSLFHQDFNYGISIGIKRKKELKKSHLTFNSGVKFQKIAVTTLGYKFKYESTGDDSSKYFFKEETQSNNMARDANSVGYYISCGIIPKTRKIELLFEFTGTLNQPYYFWHEIHYQAELIQNLRYKTNLHYVVVKLRRFF